MYNIQVDLTTRDIFRIKDRRIGNFRRCMRRREYGGLISNECAKVTILLLLLASLNSQMPLIAMFIVRASSEKSILAILFTILESPIRQPITQFWPALQPNIPIPNPPDKPIVGNHDIPSHIRSCHNFFHSL